MAPIIISDELKQSCSNHHLYPQNLIPDIAKSCHWALETYKTRLESVKNQLGIVNERDVDVSIRDLYWNTNNGVEVQKCNIHTMTRLEGWLNLSENNKPSDQVSSQSVQTAKYPKSRFIYIYSQHSRDRLRLTHGMLTRILTHHQVMAEYMDFIFAFGSQSGARELRFSDFCQQTMMEENPSIPAVLGQSWRQYQLCYNLKGVTLTQRNTEEIRLTEWSIRQAAIHHQFDIVHGTTLWIVTKGRLDLQQRFKELTGKDASITNKSFGSVHACFRSSLEAHLMFCHWATEDWRWYISWIEDVVDAETSMAIYGPQGRKYAHKQYTPRDIQDLHLWKDKTSEAAMLLRSNANIMTSLRAFYIGLTTNEDFTPRAECQRSIKFFAARMEKHINWMETQVRRVDLLAHMISDRKELILQHLQHQATERTERLSENLEREAIVMRIITIVTLIYLPATFVSTFFSTDIVKYQGSDEVGPGGGTYSPVAMMRWLQVTLPLTFVTICAAWAAYKTAKKSTSGFDREKPMAHDDGHKLTKEYV